MKHEANQEQSIAQNSAIFPYDPSQVCIMPASVGQTAHEGLRFKEDLLTIGRKYGTVLILPADTLQRHSDLIYTDLPADCDDLGALARLEVESEQRGTEWLERIQPYIEEAQKQNITIYISRWNDWRAHPEFQAKLEAIKEMYESNEKFKRAIQTSVNDYIKRVASKKGTVDEAKAITCSTRYKLEECAIISIWHEIGFQAFAYPNALCQGLYNLFQRLRNQKEALEYINLNKLKQPMSSASSAVFSKPANVAPVDLHDYRENITMQTRIVTKNLAPELRNNFIMGLIGNLKEMLHEKDMRENVRAISV
jgi:hypothetical protein